MAGIEFAEVTYRTAQGRVLLDAVSLAVERGTTTVLLGRSGSGKTTLLRTVNRMVQPTSGTVQVDGQVTIRDLNRAMDWDLPDDDWVTVAGLVIHEAQTIPEPGQTFIFHHHRFQVLRRQRNQITALKVSPPLEEAEEE